MYRNFSKSLTIKKQVDILVAGGGPSGIAAAVTAARQGKKVLILEREGCFGGAGTTGMVPSFCAFHNNVDFLASGIGSEVSDAYFGSSKVEDRNWWPVHTEAMKNIYDKMVMESGAEFLFFTQIVDAVCDEEGHVDYVVCAGKSGLFAVKAEIYLDCTGDGDLCVRAGAEYEYGDPEGRTQGTTLCSLWTNIDWDRVKQHDGSRLQEAIADGVFQVPDPHMCGIDHVTESIGGGNVGHVFGINGTDEASLTQGMLEGRRSLQDYLRYYREYLPGYEKVELAATAPYLGVRETRRIVGDYQLCLEDFKSRAVFPDEIGRFSYPVDAHATGNDNKAFEKFKDEYENLRYQSGESYGIPFRALLPRGLKNVMVAGRCISTDRSMQASIRVMPCCFITGQAIGMAAALTPEGGDVRCVNIETLQKKLVEAGAFLPNYKAAP